jgi:uncharacterized lipoprotein YddW (UPF0748 family)
VSSPPLRRAVRRPSALARLAPAALLALAACGGERATLAPPGGPAFKKGVELSRADAELMVRTPSAEPGARGGTTLALDVVLRKKNGKAQEKDGQIDWVSLDPRVATVTAEGLVTAQDTGRTGIVASYKDRSADTLALAVVAVPVKSVLLAGPDSIAVDDTVQVTATPRDSVNEPLLGRPVTWTSRTPLVASVDTLGGVVALTPGAATVQAVVEEAVGTFDIRVTEQPVATVTVAPGALTLAQFRRAGVVAVARDRRGKVLAGRTVTWASSAPAVAGLTAAGDTVVARDVGAATLTATVDGQAGTAAVTVGTPVEARALWVTRFEYTGASAVDFPKIAQIMAKAAQARFNVVYFQVRTAGDALYYSDIEPCSPRMCGRLGGPRPAQDPLEVALREAAKHGIEVHAWVNALTGFISGSTAACGQFVASTPANWLWANRDWSASTKNFTTNVITRQVDNCATTSEYMWVSPGVPAVRAQLARVSADIARRYGPLGLKGIHLDRIRYSANNVSYDPGTQEAFRAATGAFPTSNAQGAWLNARRGYVNEAVREVYESVRAVDPTMVISAAVFPGYKREGAFAGWTAQWSFSDLFQDPQAWAQGGYLDVEVPMNYPATATSTSWTVRPTYCAALDWTCVMDDHIARIERQARRHVYVGVGAIKGWDEVQRQVDLAHDRQATGVAFYSFSQVDAIPNGWANLANGPFKHPATIPAMGWKSGAVAAAP